MPSLWSVYRQGSSVCSVEALLLGRYCMSDRQGTAVACISGQCYTRGGNSGGILSCYTCHPS
jgi:hypothetical protein